MIVVRLAFDFCQNIVIQTSTTRTSRFNKPDCTVAILTCPSDRVVLSALPAAEPYYLSVLLVNLFNSVLNGQ